MIPTPVIMRESPGNVPWYRFGHHDKLVIDGVDYCIAEVNVAGIVVRRTDGSALSETFSHSEVHLRIQEESLVVFPGWYSQTKAHVRSKHGTKRLTDIEDDDELARIEWLQKQCDIFLRMEAQKLVTRSETSVASALPTIMQEVAKWKRIGKVGTGRKPRGGKRTTGLEWLSPSGLKRAVVKYERGGYDPVVFCDRYGQSGNRTPRLDEKLYEFMREAGNDFRSSNKVTKAALYEVLESRVDAENLLRREQGLPMLTAPSTRTFEKIVGDRDDFLVSVGRDGLQAAIRKRAIVNDGVDATRPLERVEIDEWQVSLQTLLISANIWQHLSAKQREEVKRTRVWISAAIDCATRCILALRLLTKAPSGSGTLNTIEQIVSDKSRIANAVGTTTPWNMHGPFETAGMDSGSGLIADVVKAAIRELGAEPLYPPSGLPQLRATIERVFRTFGDRAIAFYPGQTFANIVVKGDYDAEGHACIDAEELNRTLIRFVVDVYHNTPHGELVGETPSHAWTRLRNRWGLKAPLDSVSRRHIFGTPLTRPIRGRGVRVFGLHYQSQELQRLRQTVGRRHVRVRFDRFDLGAISVWTGNGWLSVPYRRRGMDMRGVSFWEWSAAVKDLTRHNAEMSRTSVEVARMAMAKIRDHAEMATARAELGSPILTAGDCIKAERELFRAFDFVDEGDGSDEDILGDVIDASTVELIADDDATDPMATDEISSFGDPNDLAHGEIVMAENSISADELNRLLIKMLPPGRAAKVARMTEVASHYVVTGRDAVLRHEIDRLFDNALITRGHKKPEGRILVVTGAAGSGKSLAISKALELKAAGLGEHADDLIIRTVAPSPCTLKQFGRDLLHQLGYPIQGDLKEHITWERVRQRLDEQKPLIAWVDEMQHTVNSRGNGPELKKLADTMKSMVQRPQWPPLSLIISGLDALLEFLEFDRRQIKRRCEFVHFAPMTFPKDVAGFRWLVREIIETHAQMRMTGISDEFLARLCHATSGVFGLVVYLTRSAVEIALEKDQPVVGIKQYVVAYARATGRPAAENPFVVENWEATPLWDPDMDDENLGVGSWRKAWSIPK